MSSSSRRPRSGQRIIATAATAALAFTSFAVVPSAIAQDDDTDTAVAQDADAADPDTEQGADTRGVVPPEDSPLAFLDPGPAPEHSVLRTTEQDLDGLPAGVEVEKVEWITDRWAKLYIKSAAMPDETMKVQIHLARDWYSQPEKTFPSMWMLGPLYSSEDESAWSYASDTVQFYADKNVNVVLPIGGGGSFFTDWQQPDGGKHFKWETFLTKELPPILEQGWRTNDKRGIAGLSMGATSAMILAGRNPEMFDFAGSYSGYLDTTSPGMPPLFSMITRNAGYDATKMWGPHYSQDWFAHDPKLMVSRMRDMSIYVSAGTGNTGAWDEPSAAPTVPQNLEAGVMEAASRLTSQTFVNSAKLAGVNDLQVRFRPNGTHIWAYWTYDMHEAWPYAAKALGLDESDSSIECVASEEFSEAVDRYKSERNHDLGDCISEVYDILDAEGKKTGTAQDFSNGVLYLKDGDERATATWGRTGAKYRALGGPSSWLGYPTQPDAGGGRGGVWAGFENGFMFWHPSQGNKGPVAMRLDIHRPWAATNNENGPWGYPIADEEPFRVGGQTGQLQRFEHGIAVRRPNGEVFLLRNDIAERYLDLTAAERNRLGFPTNNHSSTHVEGAFTNFDHGVIYWAPTHGASVLYHGPIYDAYAKQGYEGGDLGFLVEDEVINADGSRSAVFENGTLRADADGEVTEGSSAIQDKYNDLTEEQQVRLGSAKDHGTTAASPDGTKGRYRNYENGVIYWSPDHGGAVMYHGPTYDFYRSTDFESGRYGFLTEDETVNADGSRKAVFERGTITMDADGNVTGSLED